MDKQHRDFGGIKLFQEALIAFQRPPPHHCVMRSEPEPGQRGQHLARLTARTTNFRETRPAIPALNWPSQ